LNFAKKKELHRARAPKRVSALSSSPYVFADAYIYVIVFLLLPTTNLEEKKPHA
jgi:hypothetical protein